MNYEETMKYIKGVAKFGSNLGLERTEKILEILGDPHKKIKSIHIAGTNGKGSTTAMIAQILIEAGYKVGMYTSPYIEEFEERIQINGTNISKEELSNVVTKVSEAVREVIALGYDNPTEFEIITCAMFLFFYEQQVDFAVVEVGLGGRLDSTNVIIPLVSVITSISYDHMNILGNSLEEIALEKAGIIKNGVPLILYPQEKCVQQVMERVCKEKQVKMIKVDEESVKFLGAYEDENLKNFNENNLGDNENIKIKYHQKLNVSTEIEAYDIQLSLLGKHQLLNCATVIYTIEELITQGIKINKNSILKALKEVKWKGRLEVMANNPLVVIDGAHNIDGIKRLAESVKVYFKYNKIILILGILADKQVYDMVKTMVNLADRIITVTPHSDRAQIAEELKNVIDEHDIPCEAIDNYEEAYEKALSYCHKDDLLLLSGSLYMIGDMRKIIKMKKVL